MAEPDIARIRVILSRWGFHDLFTDSEQVDRIMMEIAEAIKPTKEVKVTNFFEQANVVVPLFAEMCRRAKFADHGGYLTLELETDDSPEGKLICFVEAGDSLDELLQKTAIEWGEG